MKNISLYTILSLFILVGLGCDHETDFFDGPNLEDRFGEFNLLEDLAVNRTTVDFSAGEDVRMTARFNKNVDFIIRITGLESGAVKVSEGFDKQILPRFKFKHRVTITPVTEGDADMVFGYIDRFGYGFGYVAALTSAGQFAPFYQQNPNVTASEPGTIAMFGVAMLLLVSVKRRNQTIR